MSNSDSWWISKFARGGKLYQAEGTSHAKAWNGQENGKRFSAASWKDSNPVEEEGLKNIKDWKWQKTGEEGTLRPKGEEFLCSSL